MTVIGASKVNSVVKELNVSPMWRRLAKFYDVPPFPASIADWSGRKLVRALCVQVRRLLLGNKRRACKQTAFGLKTVKTPFMVVMNIHEGPSS